MLIDLVNKKLLYNYVWKILLITYSTFAKLLQDKLLVIMTQYPSNRAASNEMQQYDLYLPTT